VYKGYYKGRVFAVKVGFCGVLRGRECVTLLGKGAQGRVYKGSYKGRVFAVKVGLVGAWW
jgi:hypothetical protein